MTKKRLAHWDKLAARRRQQNKFTSEIDNSHEVRMAEHKRIDRLVEAWLKGKPGKIQATTDNIKENPGLDIYPDGGTRIRGKAKAF